MAVYLIEAVGEPFVKLGSTADVPKRIAGIQTNNPRRIRLIAQIPGDERDEQELAAKYAKYRIRGEWYELALPMIEEIMARARETTPLSMDERKAAIKASLDDGRWIVWRMENLAAPTPERGPWLRDLAMHLEARRRKAKREGPEPTDDDLHEAVWKMEKATKDYIARARR